MENAPVLVDSNIYIELQRAGIDPARALVPRYGSLDLAICGMVRMEVLRGMRGDKAIRCFGAFFDVLQNVPADAKIWDKAADLGRATAKAGFTVPGPDLVIAASALRIGAAILTRDRHFEAMPGVRVIEPPESW